jgi:predicted CopG family antitoxin
MAATTVRIRPHTYRVLQEMARERGESLPDALDRIVEEKRRAQMFREANAAYAAIAADPVEDALWRAEIAAWDGTLLDGLPAKPESWDEE